MGKAKSNGKIHIIDVYLFQEFLSENIEYNIRCGINCIPITNEELKESDVTCKSCIKEMIRIKEYVSNLENNLVPHHSYRRELK